MPLKLDAQKFPADPDHLLADFIVLDAEFFLATGAKLPRSAVLAFLREHLTDPEAERLLYRWMSTNFIVEVGDRLEPSLGAHAFLSRHRINQTITPVQAWKWLREHLPHYEGYFREIENNGRNPR